MATPFEATADSPWRIKLFAARLRLEHIARWFPRRLMRIVRHFRQGFSFRKKKNPILPGILWWWVDLVFYLLDLFGFGECYETLADFVKWNTRPLTVGEIAVGQEVFGDSLTWALVRLDDRAWIGPRQRQICYVSGYTINSWGAINNPLLVHELMHVWQYEHDGLVYIPRALRAYHSAEGYNYGGLQHLRQLYELGAALRDLNYEQQGDVVADYYRLTKGLPPQWGFAGMDALPVYAYFVGQLNRE